MLFDFSKPNRGLFVAFDQVVMAWGSFWSYDGSCCSTQRSALLSTANIVLLSAENSDNAWRWIQEQL